MTVNTLLDFIADHESNGDYNIVWGGIKSADRPRKPLTSMTIGEVLAWQDSIDARYQSEAAGKYQIMEDTLRGLYAEAGMKLTDLFDVSGQDRLGRQLLVRRGLNQYLAGTISTETFANNLAKEWASLPVVTGAKKGRSYYAGDGLNAAGVSVEPFLAAVREVKDAPAPIAAPAPTPPKNPLIAIMALLRSIFGVRK